MNGIDQSIGPGLGGFIAFFLLACALWLLMRNMSKHLRNVAYLQEQEADEARRAAGGDATTGSTPAADPADFGDVQSRPRRLSDGYPRAHEQPRNRAHDAGATDAGAMDAGATDAGATDAGAMDAGPARARGGEHDTGSTPQGPAVPGPVDR